MIETLSIGIVCMALNVYHEAKNQTIEGMLAVGEVVLNRVEDERFPNSVCDVVKQGPIRESWKTRQTPDPDDAVYYPIRHRCQFSWYCDGKSDKPFDEVAWQQAQSVASMLFKRGKPNLTDGATHYHADYVLPEWAASKTFTIKIGDHVFYRWEKSEKSVDKIDKTKYHNIMRYFQ